jgi:hypothetical protein
MPLRNYSLRVAGAAGRVDNYRNPREVARRLGALYVTVRPHAKDLLLNAVFDVPDEPSQRSATCEALLEAARQSLPSDLRARMVFTEQPNRPHEITAQILENKRRGTPALAGALQAHEDLEAWDDFLATARPRGLVELGTGSGSFSKWLSERVEWFRTIDIGPPQPGTPGFIRLNIWDQSDAVRDLIARAPRPFILYCDNGDKRLEVETYAPALEVGDFLAVHDLGTEIFRQDIPSVFKEQLTFGLTGFYERQR